MLPNKYKMSLNRKPNKKVVDQCSEFWNRSSKSWLQDNDIGMCSMHN